MNAAANDGGPPSGPVPPGDRGPIARWAADLAMGARFAVTGGRESWARTVMTAVGVGLGVAMLLFAAATPHIISAQNGRDAARATGEVLGTKPGPRTVVVASTGTTFHDKNITGTLIHPDGDRPALPPGVAAMPAPGEMVVSPALKKLLDSPGTKLLRERLDYRVVGTIGDRGLKGPSELRYYAGADRATLAGYGFRMTHWGTEAVPAHVDAVLMLLIIVGCVVLLLPVAIFVATAVRFGGERRDRRLAALRLVGADARMTRRIAAGEALAGALLGLAVGAVLFLPLRQLAGSVTLFDTSVFPADVQPDARLAVLIALAVPVCAVAVTLFTLRGVTIEPLGVVRRGVPRRRRLWWRLAFPVVGLVLLLPAVGSIRSSATISTVTTYQIAFGAVLLLVGSSALLPWAIETAVGRIRGGSVSWQLATRRLQMSSGTAARAVSGITVAVAGAIALQALLSGVQSMATRSTGHDPARAQIEVSLGTAKKNQVQELTHRFRATKGVKSVVGDVDAEVGQATSDPSEVRLTVADCRDLRQLARIGRCRDGDVYLAPDSVDPDAARLARPGVRLDLTDGDGKPVVWTVPASARRVRTRQDALGDLHEGILATPSAVKVSALGNVQTIALVGTDPDQPDAAEYVRNTAARISPFADVWSIRSTSVSGQFRQVRTGLLIGAMATMALIGASMLVSTLEQLRERRKLLSVLVAFGTRRTTLGLSVLWQTAVPVVLGLALSVAAGLALGAVLLRMAGTGMTDWWSFLPMVGLGAGLILAVTLLSMGPLWRMMRPDGLRTE